MPESLDAGRRVHTRQLPRPIGQILEAVRQVFRQKGKGSSSSVEYFARRFQLEFAVKNVERFVLPVVGIERRPVMRRHQLP